MPSSNTYCLTWVSLTLDGGYPFMAAPAKCSLGFGKGKSGAERSYSTSEVRGGGREEQLHIQGAVAARVQEGLEELLHIQGQEGQR